MCPEDTTPPVRRGPRIVEQERAAARFQVSAATIRNWISHGYITGYRVPGDRMPWVDPDEIEVAFTRYPRTKMRDGRRTYGAKARIVAVPVMVAAAETRSEA